MLEHYVTPETNLQTFLDTLDPLYFHTIYLSKGVYRQKVALRLSNVTFIGESKTDTTLIFNDYNYKFHSDGLLYNTFRTPTLTITGSNNKLKNLTIQNDAGTGERIGQAIALAIYGNHTTITNCNILGNQDTLFIGPLPEDLALRYAHILPLEERFTQTTLTKINNSRIEGNVDFIFGSGNCLFNQCELVFNQSGYLSAPSTYEKGIGFVFYHCTIKSLNPDFKTVLARPWRNHAKVTFINNHFIDLNLKTRYHDWEKTHFEFREYPYIEHPLSQTLDEAFKQRLVELFFT